MDDAGRVGGRGEVSGIGARPDGGLIDARSKIYHLHNLSLLTIFG
jgi:hypothetical protein